MPLTIGKAVKVPGIGEISEVLTGAIHSQFTDDRQASMLLLLCLKSKAGVVALEALVKDPTDSLTGSDARLHIQTFYPQVDPMREGASCVESTKYPALDLTYL